MLIPPLVDVALPPRDCVTAEVSEALSPCQLPVAFQAYSQYIHSRKDTSETSAQTLRGDLCDIRLGEPDQRRDHHNGRFVERS